MQQQALADELQCGRYSGGGGGEAGYGAGSDAAVFGRAGGAVLSVDAFERLSLNGGLASARGVRPGLGESATRVPGTGAHVSQVRSSSVLFSHLLYHLSEPSLIISLALLGLLIYYCCCCYSCF